MEIENKKQWYPAFCAAMELEFREDKDAIIASKDAIIADRDNMIADRDTEIAKLKQQLLEANYSNRNEGQNENRNGI